MIWLTDGDVLVMTAGATKFLRIPATGGAQKPPVAFDLGGAAGYPKFVSEMPGGAGVLTMIESWGARGYQEDIWLLDAATGKASKLIENGASRGTSRPPDISCFRAGLRCWPCASIR